MRVMLATLPELSHALPAIPLCWALRAAGADVVIVSGGDVVKATGAGLPVIDLLPGRGISDFLRAFDLAALATGQDPFGGQPAQTLGSDLVMPSGDAVAEELESAPDYAEFIPHVSQMLPEADILALMGMMHRFVDVAEQWRPDVIVYGPMTIGALAAASKLGIPAVEHGFGFLRTAGLSGLLRLMASDVFDKHGVELPEEIHHIDVAPPSMLEDGPEGWPMRYVPYNGGAVVADWLTRAPERPRVAVTLGNLVTQLASGHGLVARLIEQAAKVDAEFVLALGDNVDESLLRSLPANVRAAGYLPLTQLLPTCAAVIHHGGAGSSMNALDAGIPQLVIPHLFDHRHTADLVVKRGVGLSAESDLADGTLDTLVHDSHMRAASREVQAEIRALPSPHEMATQVLELGIRG